MKQTVKMTIKTGVVVFKEPEYRITTDGKVWAIESDFSVLSGFTSEAECLTAATDAGMKVVEIQRLIPSGDEKDTRSRRWAAIGGGFFLILGVLVALGLTGWQYTGGAMFDHQKWPWVSPTQPVPTNSQKITNREG